MDDPVMKCSAVLTLKGEHFHCDWPIDPDTGDHDGWAHGNKEAQAIWCGVGECRG